LFHLKEYPSNIKFKCTRQSEQEEEEEEEEMDREEKEEKRGEEELMYRFQLISLC
jgi:hypothetical protein